MVLSFDIDGTLEAGDPPGPVTMARVRRAKGLGYLIGSSSDRTLSEQRNVWRAHGIGVDFVSRKHELDALRARIGEARYIHIGDTTVDEHYARLAGFEFWYVNQLPREGTDDWIV